MAKGQGLPLEFIVIAAISALIIVLVIAFTIGGLGGSFKQISVTGGGDELSSVQTACQTACNTLQTTASSVSQFASSSYCTKRYSIDLNKDGKISSGNETGIMCWSATKSDSGKTLTKSPGPGVTCAIQIGDVSVTEANCTGYKAG